MHAIVGIERARLGKSAVQLLKNLDFPGLSMEFVHVIESMQVPGWGHASWLSPDVFAEAYRERSDEGQEILKQAVESAGMPDAPRTLLTGYVADQILARAAETEADLIAVDAAEKKPLAAFLLGSVSRALVVSAKTNLLIAKGQVEPSDSVHAVLATDHSEYCNKCIERLIEMRPRGLRKLTVLTSYPRSLMDVLRPTLPDFALNPAVWIEEHLHQHNQELIGRLSAAGWECESRVVGAPPYEAIPEAMRETGAQLLILGAQGHGVVQRLTLGSVSFHQVSNESYPVLVLRV
ncbi:MAG: universal stress protein [Fimbriimonadaceae bacterium]